MNQNTKICNILLLMTVLLVGICPSFGQTNAIDKMDPQLQKKLSESPTSKEKLNVVILLSDHYDELDLTNESRFLDKKARRQYVVETLQAFARSSQAELLQWLEDGARSGLVEQVHPFWIFNGISFTADRDFILSIADRADVAAVFSNEYENLLPEEWNPKAVEPARGNVWNITQVNADDVWNYYQENSGFTGKGILVAIIDSGVNYNHVDLINNMWDGGADFPHHGYDFVNKDNDPIDDCGHGTHCAGTIAGYGFQGTRTGIAPEATIMALKSLDSSGNGLRINSIAAIEFAIQYGADIISMSIAGKGGGYAFYRDAMVAAKAAGVVVSVAAGNYGDKLSETEYNIPYNIATPGNCPPPWLNPDQSNVVSGGTSAVVCVGATTNEDKKATFSSVGPASWTVGSSIPPYYDYPYVQGDASKIGLIRPDVAAPGVDITSLTYNNNTGYCNMNGTSMATPCVTGVMALMLEADPSLTPADIDSIIETTAVKCEAMVVKNNLYGAGRVDALAAINAVLSNSDAPTNLTAIRDGRDVSLSWTAASTSNSYSIFRNGVKIATCPTTQFFDRQLFYGHYTYYVKGNGNETVLAPSMPSNSVSVDIADLGPVVNDLNAFVLDNDIQLSWSAVRDSDTLQYSTRNETKVLSSGKAAYWGQKFSPEMLVPYGDMSISKVSIYIAHPSDYTLRIYEGGINVMQTLKVEQNIRFTTTGWNDFELETPMPIDCSKNLWITFYTNTATASMTYCYSSDNSTAILYSGDGIIWENLGNIFSWKIRTLLERNSNAKETYTYNLFRNGTLITSDLALASYTDANLSNGSYTYVVKTNFGSEQSASSDEAHAKLPSYAITYSYNGNTNFFSKLNVNPSESIVSLPKPFFGDIPDGFDFIGWTTSAVELSDTQPLLISNGFVPTENLTLYAVFAISETTRGRTEPQLLNLDGSSHINQDEASAETFSHFTTSISMLNADQTVSSDQTWNNNVSFNGFRVTVAENATLTVTGAIGNTFDNKLIIKEGGQLIHNNANLHATVERNLQPWTTDPVGGWYTISSPVANQAISGVFTPDGTTSNRYDLYRYDEPTATWLNQKAESNAFAHTSFLAGTGYLASYEAETRLKFAGILNVHAAIDLTSRASELQGFNLIANPYAHDIYLGAAISNDNLSDGYYHLTNDGSWSVGTNIDAIKPCQGLLVKTSADITALPIVKTNQPNSTKNLNTLIGIEVKGDDGFDKAYIHFGEGIGLDKIDHLNNYLPKLYVKLDDKNYAYAVVSQDIIGLEEIPICFTVNKSGRYTLSVKCENSMFDYLHLIDRLTGADIDILNGDSYTFQADAGDLESRFALMFRPSSDVEDPDDSFVYLDHDKMIISQIKSESTLQVIDMSGRIVHEEDLNRGAFVTLKVPAGIYLVRLTSSKSMKVQKIVVDSF